MLIKVKHTAKLVSVEQPKFQMHNFHWGKSLVSTNKQYKLFLLNFFSLSLVCNVFFRVCFTLVTRFNFIYRRHWSDRMRNNATTKNCADKISFWLNLCSPHTKTGFNFFVSLFLFSLVGFCFASAFITFTKIWINM